jgi:hypothetical protein
VSLETRHMRAVMSEQRNKMDGAEALGPTHIIGHRLKVSADKEREMSNYDVSWKASALGMCPFDEDGDEFGPIAGPTGQSARGLMAPSSAGGLRSNR